MECNRKLIEKSNKVCCVKSSTVSTAKVVSSFVVGVTHLKFESSAIKSLRLGREQHVPDSSNLSLYLNTPRHRAHAVNNTFTHRHTHTPCTRHTNTHATPCHTLSPCTRHTNTHATPYHLSKSHPTVRVVLVVLLVLLVRRVVRMVRRVVRGRGGDCNATLAQDTPNTRDTHAQTTTDTHTDISKQTHKTDRHTNTKHIVLRLWSAYYLCSYSIHSQGRGRFGHATVKLVSSST